VSIVSLFSFYELDIANAISDILNDSTINRFLLGDLKNICLVFRILFLCGLHQPDYCYWMYAVVVLDPQAPF
jgi:hypothetical protein